VSTSSPLAIRGRASSRRSKLHRPEPIPAPREVASCHRSEAQRLCPNDRVVLRTAKFPPIYPIEVRPTSPRLATRTKERGAARRSRRPGRSLRR
jgi:hypothetical protein